MASDLPQTDIRAFYAYLGDRIGSSAESFTPEDSVREFRTHQQQLNRFLRESESAFEHARRDEGRELDVGEVMKRVEGA